MSKIKKLRKRISENKVLLILGIILIVCFILVIIALFRYFYAGDNTTKYGDRLDGSEKYKVHSSLNKDIESLYGEEIDKVNVEVQGKIIYVVMNLTKVIEKSDAEALALKSLDKFTENEKEYYDIQYIITCDSEEGSSTETKENAKKYPIEGYKNSTSSVISWTNN